MQSAFQVLKVVVLVAMVLSAIDATAEDGSLLYLDNTKIRIGVDKARGGAIGYLSDADSNASVINVHDLGRWVGQSYYAGPKPFGTAHPAWKDWPWNPVSAGDVYDHPSQLLEATNDGKRLYVKSIPMQWALNNVPGDCLFETWITLQDRTVRVRNRVTNKRQDPTRYEAMDQELPFVYTVGRLHRLVSYTGEAPFEDGAVSEIPKPAKMSERPQWQTFFATEHWAALVDDNDWGLGVIHPGVVRFVGGFQGNQFGGGPQDDATGYLAPVRREILDHNIVYDFEYTLVLDTLANIRAEAARQRVAATAPDYHFSKNREHWSMHNAKDEGFPWAGSWKINLDQDDPQLFSPEGFWKAEDARRWRIRAAFKTQNSKAELFWATTSEPAFAPTNSARFDIIPDGKFHTYEVDLSNSPTYQGAIRGLRFDPVETGAAGETVAIEFITAKPE